MKNVHGETVEILNIVFVQNNVNCVQMRTLSPR